MAPLKLAPLVLAKPFSNMLGDLVAQGCGVWVVGGWVRDCVLAQRPHDADFCTTAGAKGIAEAASKHGVNILLDRVAAIHGTYRLEAGGETLDLARLRQDVTRLGARHAEVTFTQDLQQDLSRRDLTINALALPYPLPKKTAAQALSQALVDAHGGLADLQAKVLRLIGNAEQRLEEDPLRLLRIARFACLGEAWQVEPGTAAAMANLAHLLPTVSVERRLAELMRALSLPCPARFWQLLQASGATASLLPATAAAPALLRAQTLLAAGAKGCDDPLLRFCFFILGAVLPPEARTKASADTAPPPAPKLVLRPASRNAALAWMAPLRFAKVWQDVASTVASAWVLEDTAWDDEAVVRWALSLGPRHLATLSTLCRANEPSLQAFVKPTQQVLARLEELAGGRSLWRGPDLNLDAPALFAELEVGEGAIRKWLLLELLVHAWLHPEDNTPAALTQVAQQFNPTQGTGRDRVAAAPDATS